jgi:hypothetical protein
MKKNISLFVLGSGIVALLAGAFRAKKPAIVVAEEYGDAYNGHGVQQVLALPADDAMIHTDGVVLQGKDKLRGIAQFDSVMNTHITSADLKATGDTVTFTAKEENDG